jgi:hypothetical protein
MYLVATRGDVVLRIDRQDDLVEFLGPIDTSADARLLLEWAGYGLCDSTGVEKAAGGFETSASSISNTCPVEGKRVQLQITADGRLKELSSEPLAKSDACVGRRPEGLVSAGTSTETNALAAHFASVAELEAAAVAAFDVIACELEHYGAPPELIAAARAAAADEVRHTRDTARLARRFHGTVRAPLIEPRPVRSLESFAEDNAAEGCVRETFGALFGHYQAATARDPEIAEVMHQIADDETRHAALSHRIARWVEPRLTAAGRKRVASARATALTTLFRELQAEPAPELRALAGVPDAATAKRLLESLVAEFV